MKVPPRHASAILNMIAGSTATYTSTSHKPVTFGDIRDALESVLDERTMLREAIKKSLGSFKPLEEDDEPHPSIVAAMDRLRAALELTKGDD